MKSRFRILVCTMIVTAFCSVLSAQVNNNLSKAQLVKFTNANAKFTVPPGKHGLYMVLLHHFQMTITLMQSGSNLLMG